MLLPAKQVDGLQNFLVHSLLQDEIQRSQPHRCVSPQQLHAQSVWPLLIAYASLNDVQHEVK